MSVHTLQLLQGGVKTSTSPNRQVIFCSCLKGQTGGFAQTLTMNEGPEQLITDRSHQGVRVTGVPPSAVWGFRAF